MLLQKTEIRVQRNSMLLRKKCTPEKNVEISGKSISDICDALSKDCVCERERELEPLMPAKLPDCGRWLHLANRCSSSFAV